LSRGIPSRLLVYFHSSFPIKLMSPRLREARSVATAMATELSLALHEGGPSGTESVYFPDADGLEVQRSSVDITPRSAQLGRRVSGFLSFAGARSGCENSNAEGETLRNTKEVKA